MASIFTRIVRGEIPSHKVHEDPDHLAFLDINPAQVGHTLVIPKREVDCLFDLEPDEYRALWDFVRVVERGVRQVTACQRVVVMVVGYEVPHAHIHLIPTDQLTDVPFPARVPQSAAELAETAAKINAVVS